MVTLRTKNVPSLTNINEFDWSASNVMIINTYFFKQFNVIIIIVKFFNNVHQFYTFLKLFSNETEIRSIHPEANEIK